MSPEQALDSTDTDGRSDLYSLGATLFFLLHGRPPFQHATVLQTLRAHCDEPVPSLQQPEADVPEQLDRIYRRMLEKAPDDRFQTADEVVAALESLVDGRKTETALPSVRRKRSRMAKLVAACALVLAGLAAVIHVVTDTGDLIVNSNDPNVKVIVKRGEVVVAQLPRDQGDTSTTIRSGQYAVELLPADAKLFQLDRDRVTVSRGENTLVTISEKAMEPVGKTADSVRAGLPFLCSFRSESDAAEYWRWNDALEFSTVGARAGRGAASWLRSRHLFGDDVTIELDFSLGQAQYSNTGGASLLLWNTRIPIASGMRRVDVWMRIHREDDEVVVQQNDDEPRRIAIDPQFGGNPTPVTIYWRSRSSHFRRIRIDGERVAQGTPETRGLFTFRDREHAENHWSWNDDFTFAADGAMSPRGPSSFLRSRHRYGRDLSVDLEFRLGEAAYRNTGDAWLVVWNQRIKIASKSVPVDMRLHVHRENDEIVWRLNGSEQRVRIETEESPESTSLEVRWRTRTAHLRRIEIHSGAVAP